VRKTPLVLGAFAIVFGVITGALMLFAALFGLEPSPDITADQRLYQMLSTATFGGLAFALVGVGLGLIRRKRWSRAGGIVWALAALAVVEFEYYVMGQLAPRTAVMYVVLAVEAIFPLTVLVLLVRRSAKNDFISPAR
jgi:hypothetical protein